MPKTEIYIYGVIGKPWWADESYDGVSEMDVINALDSLDKADEHTVHFNSAGGLVKVGIGIMNGLRAHVQRQQLTNKNFQLHTINDGICYSAATYGFLAGTKRTVNLGANTLLHCAATYVEGNAEELRNMATELDQVDNNLAELYANLLSQDKDHWLNIMSLNKIVNGEKAVELGLATHCATTEAMNLFPDFSPENVQKEGFAKLLSRAMNTQPTSKPDLFTRPGKSSTSKISNKVISARIASSLARLDKR